MKAGHQQRASGVRPSDPDIWAQTSEARSHIGAKVDLFAARVTTDVTRALRGCVRVEAFQRGVAVAFMPCDLLSRHFLDSPGDAA